MNPNEYHYVMTIRWVEYDEAPGGGAVAVPRYDTADDTWTVDSGEDAEYIYRQVLASMRRVNNIPEYHCDADEKVAVINWTLTRNQGLHQS